MSGRRVRASRGGGARLAGLVLATPALGFAAHALGGASGGWSCLPMVVSALLGVLATLGADAVAGYHRRNVGGAVALLGAGQLAMHLVLAGALTAHAHFAADLTCGVTLAHATATGGLTVLLLGAQRSLAVVTALVARIGDWIRVPYGSPRLPVPEAPAPPVAAPAAPAVRMPRYGPVRPRRGPPALPA